MYQSNRSLNMPPWAYPGHLTSFPAREGGNLMNLVFPGAGHLITTHRGWGIWSLASIWYYESGWFQIMAETNLDAFIAKDTWLVAHWLTRKGLRKLYSEFEGIQEPYLWHVRAQLPEHDRSYWKVPGVGAFDHLECTECGPNPLD